MAVLLNGNSGQLQNTYLYRKPDLTFKVSDNIVDGCVDGLESIQQSVYNILMTERYSSRLYTDDYGVELEQYVNKDIGTIKAGIEDTLRDALTHDDRITDVAVNSVTQSDKDSTACLIDFTVSTIYGDFEQELSIS